MNVYSFFNECINYADGKSLISEKVLLEAEGAYSRGRLTALCDEWVGVYPHLIDLTQLLKGRRSGFNAGELTSDDLDLLALRICDEDLKVGVDYALVDHFINKKMSLEAFRVEVVQVLYKVGVLGLKTGPRQRVSWSYQGEVGVSNAEINGSSRLFIHKALWRVLGIDSGRAIPDDDTAWTRA